MLDQVHPVDPAAPGGPELLLEGPATHKSVLGLVGAVTDDPAGQLELAALRHRSVAEVAAGDHRQPGERAVGHGDVDDLALAGAARLIQGGQDADRGHHPAAAEVRDLTGRLDGWPILLA